jgi:hypothetical protein
MKRLIRFILFIPVSFFILCVSNPAFACTCRGAEHPPCVAFREASAVFSGVVTDIADVPFQQGDTFHHLLIHFSIEQSYKGDSGSKMTVVTITGTSCDFGFQKGGKYFVYAYQDSKHNRLVTGVCSRTKRLSYAKEDLNYAEGLNDSNQRTSILGADDKYSSLLQEAEILIEGEGKKYRAIADNKGAFKVELAQSGKYRITVIGQAGYEFLNHHNSWRVFSVKGRPAVEFERGVSEGQCDFIDFSEYVTVRKK